LRELSPTYTVTFEGIRDLNHLVKQDLLVQAAMACTEKRDMAVQDIYAYDWTTKTEWDHENDRFSFTYIGMLR
jgi:hypothetical protein